MWAVLGGLLVNLVTSASFLFLVMADHPLLALAIGYGLSLPYNLLATVGVWRSAEHYDGDRQMADMAKAVTIVRGGSVCLNSLAGFYKWISASVMQRPGLVAAG